MFFNVLAAIADLGTHQLAHGAVCHHGILDRHALQDAGLGIHRRRGELLGVHLAQTLVALACGGALGFGDQPAHGLAEVADLFGLGLFAFTACDLGAFGQQTGKAVRFGRQGGVVLAAHKVLREDGALDVAVVVAADAQDGVLGVWVEFRSHGSRHAGGGQFAQLGFQHGGAGLGVFQRVELDLHAIGNGAQGFGVQEVRQALNDHFCGQVHVGQLGQLFAFDGARRSAAGGDGCVIQRDLEQVLVQRGAVFQVQLFLAVLDFVQRWLGDVDVATLDQLRHLAVEEGQQQGTDVGTVHVRVGHDDDAVVTCLISIEVFADVGADGGDQRADGVAGKRAMEAGALDVEDLAAQRQDRLRLTVARLLGGAEITQAVFDNAKEMKRQADELKKMSV